MYKKKDPGNDHQVAGLPGSKFGFPKSLSAHFSQARLMPSPAKRCATTGHGCTAT
jgi:hypothetical protein